MDKEHKRRIPLLLRVAIGFFFLDVLFIIFSVYNFQQFRNNYRTDKKLVKIYMPSLKYSYELKMIVLRSESLLKSWVFIDKDTAADTKKELIRIHRKEISEIKDKFKLYISYWTKEEQEVYFKTILSLDTLVNEQFKIMSMLNRYSSYSSAIALFAIYPKVREKGELVMLTKRVLANVDSLITLQEQEFEKFVKGSEEAFQRFRVNLILVTIGFVFITALILLLLSRRINTLVHLSEAIKKMSLGQLPELNIKYGTDEIGEMTLAIEKLVDGLKRISLFALDIGKNKFDTEFEPLSKDDVLGNALLIMRDNLIKAQKEAELRRIENTQRSWASQGIAEINELIRNVGNDLEKLAREVIFHIVNYTGSILGGIYILNNDDPDNVFLELKAFYAYDRHKYIQQKIKIGETLVGQCFYEGKTIYMNDVPDDYVKIVSGLGSDKPKAILIVPLIVNEEGYGVLELASFEDYPKYKIEFVEKIAETIAAAIATVKINIKTTKLLEETHEKTERLTQQEIKARENIARIEAKLTEVQKQLKKQIQKNEELEKEKEKLIEEMQKLKQEFEQMLKEEERKYEALAFAINVSVPYYELSINGDFINANNKYLELINAQKDEVIGNKHIKFISREFINSGNYKKIWDTLKKGQNIYTTVHYIIDGKSKFITENFIPIMNEKGELEKVIVFSQI